MLRERVGALSTPSVDHNGDRDVFVQFRTRIVQIQNRLDGGKNDNAPSGEIRFEGSIDSPQIIDPIFPLGSTVQDTGSAEWTDLPQEMLGLMEDYQLPDDFLLSTSIGQVMDAWI